MPAASSHVELTSHQREDGTWYVEIIRPGVVCEHVGDFKSREAAERWIRENERTYSRAQSGHSPSKHRPIDFED